MLYLEVIIKRYNQHEIFVNCIAQFENRNFCAWQEANNFSRMNQVLEFIDACQAKIEEQNQNAENEN